MAARKLQADIDRVLKLVQQGVANFEDTFDKMNNASNQTSKDKAEADLKTSIKKLQRQRDQIKTWLQSNDIKDKSVLMEHRKLIEAQMERFKACEKEMKTKAFSKEGLSAQQKLDPKEVAKMEMVSWISGMVDELSQQIERTEAEVETLRGASKKKKATADGRTSELEALNDRRRWHIGKLELIMRLLENGNIQTDSVSAIKDDIQYYVESNTEEDFTEDDDLYETLNLAEEEEHYGMHDDLQSSHDTASNIEEASSTPSKPEGPLSAAAARRATKPSPGVSMDDALAGEKSPTKEKAQPAARGPGVRKPTLDSTTARPIIPTSRPAPQPAPSNGPAPRSVPPTMPTLRYASAAAAAAAPVATPASTAAPVTPTASAVKSPTGPAASVPSPAAIVPPTPSAVAPPITSPPAPAPSASPEAKKSSLPAPPPGLADHLPAKPTTELPHAEPPTPAAAAPQPPQPQPEPVQPVQQRSTTPALSDITSAQATSRTGSVSLDPNAAGAAVASALAQQTGQQAPSLPSQTPSAINQGLPSVPANAAPSTAPTAEQDTRLPSSLADLVGTFESLKTREPDAHRTANALEAGFGSMPEVEDAEKPTHYYVPKHPWTGTPAYYPREPAGWNREVGMWTMCDVDVLFYVFYYLPGGYMQYLAAKELKKRAWRFHKQYLTWFQRADEPVEMTDDYEAGAYIYFDWEKHWTLRQKPHFTFEYKWLEDSF